MSELKTLRKTDAEFESYLLGTFSKTLRAIPVESLNVNNENESVTFRIVPKEKIEKPPFLILWAQTLKIKKAILVLFPLFVVLMKNIMDGTIQDPQSGVLAALGAVCLHTALNLRNDFVDHMKGVDRLHPQAGSRSIQNGWVTAASVQNWAWIYSALAILFGLPAILKYHLVAVLVVVLGILGVILLNSYNMGLKYRRWSELIVFLLLGPFLTVGFQASLGVDLDLEVIWIGVISGWFGVFILHLRNFELLMVQSQAKFQNTITWLGFEDSKKLLFAWWFIFLALFLSYHFVYSAQYWTWALTVLVIFPTWAFSTSLLNLSTPVGSGMVRVLQQALHLQLFVISLWFMENLFYLYLVERSAL